MDLLYKMLTLLDSKMKTPTMYGWFHIMFLFLTIIVTILLYRKYKNSNDKIKKVILVCSLIMLVFEGYKQINFSFKYDAINTWWSYEWYAFPFQFCSTPMYVALLAALTKNKKVQDIAYSFLVTYGLVGGIAVMLYPSTVFVSSILISMQTMFHHGLMVVMGLFLLITKQVKFNFSTIKKGFIMFLFLVFIALFIDIFTYYLNIDNGLEMFYISPYHVCSLPVFEMIYRNVPYIVFLFIYITVFTLGSSITIYIAKVINKIMKSKRCNRVNA